MACGISGQYEYEERQDVNGRAGEAGAPAGGPADGPASMGSPVTPHAGITEVEDWRFLACGIDTLDLGVYVKWGDNWQSLRDELGKGKERARVSNRPVFFRDTCAGTTMICPTGKPPMYRYHLHAKDFHLYLAIASEAENTPNVYVSFLSKSIWRSGVRRLVELIKQLISEFGGDLRSIKPSRVDLCADFLIPGGVTLEMLREYGVPADVMTCDIMKGASLETYYIGSPSASIRARVYDKAKECLEHHKEFFKDIWEVDQLGDVWRVEFQLRREALKSYGLDSIESLLAAQGSLWADLTGNWYSLRLQDDSNTSRRTVHPFWQAVQACAERFGPVGEITRQLAPSGNATADYYTSRAANLLVGYAACVGLADLTEAMESFTAAIGNRWDSDDFFDAYAAKVVNLNDRQLSPVQEEEYDDDIPF